MGFHDSIYKNMPCYRCRECQKFNGYESYDKTFKCSFMFAPDSGEWDPNTNGTYPGECKYFKKIAISDSEKEADKVQAEGEQKFAAFIGKLISFPISGFGYVFAISLIIGLISGGGLFPTSLWVWAGGPLVLGILIGILKAKTKIVGKILYVIGFLLIAVVFILSKVLPQG